MVNAGSCHPQPHSPSENALSRLPVGEGLRVRAFSFSLCLEREGWGEGEILRVTEGLWCGYTLTLTLSQRERGIYPRMKRT